jgi:hypothetical protein
MGLELHITRKENWYDKDPGTDISLAEWIQYVTQDPEFRLDGYAQVELPDGQVFGTEDEGIAVWTAYSQDGVNQHHAWFTYFQGNVSVKNPDQEIINKMVAIAQALGANVQDDEGGLYEKESYLDRELQKVKVTSSVKKKPWWRFWE